MQIFTRFWKVPGAFPLAHVFKRRAILYMPTVHRRDAHRIKACTELKTSQSAKCHRRVIGPEGGGAHRWNRFTNSLRYDAHAIDVAGFALIGAKTERRVALDVLNRFKAFSRGEQDVGCSYVGLKVDELLGRAAWGQPVRYEPQSL